MWLCCWLKPVKSFLLPDCAEEAGARVSPTEATTQQLGDGAQESASPKPPPVGDAVRKAAPGRSRRLAAGRQNRLPIETRASISRCQAAGRCVLGLQLKSAPLAQTHCPFPAEVHSRIPRPHLRGPLCPAPLGMPSPGHPAAASLRRRAARGRCRTLPQCCRAGSVGSRIWAGSAQTLSFPLRPAYHNPLRLALRSGADILPDPLLLGERPRLCSTYSGEPARWDRGCRAWLLGTRRLHSASLDVGLELRETRLAFLLQALQTECLWGVEQASHPCSGLTCARQCSQAKAGLMREESSPTPSIVPSPALSRGSGRLSAAGEGRPPLCSGRRAAPTAGRSARLSLHLEEGLDSDPATAASSRPAPCASEKDLLVQSGQRRGLGDPARVPASSSVWRGAGLLLSLLPHFPLIVRLQGQRVDS